MTTAAERETVINASDGDGLVRIYTMQRRYIGRLRRNPKFTLIGEGVHNDGAVWAEFTIPASEWNPATGAKRANYATAEQKARSAEQLRKVRATSREIERR